MINKYSILLIISFWWLSACNSPSPETSNETVASNQIVFDEEAERAKILALHHAQRNYHVNKHADSLAQLLSEDVISVNRGLIYRPTYEENKNRFTNYFNQVEFIKWDDIDPPIIRFSKDGHLAYTVVHKEVLLKVADENGKEVQERTEFSWLAIYAKHGEEWKIDCMASTNLPSEIIQEETNE